LGVADYSHVIALKPQAMEAWYNRGTAFLAAHQYDRAIADLNEAIRLRPDSARAYCNRGLAYMEKSDYEKALDDVDAGIQKDASLSFSITSELTSTRKREIIKRPLRISPKA
jgi:tetratricopeptide (TPR) repeat protein